MTGRDFKTRVLLDQGRQFDSVQPRHVHVRDHQIVMTGAHGVPAIHAVHRHVGQVAAAGQEFPNQLAHGE